MRRPTLTYLKTESGAGLILICAAALALMAANSPYAERYFALCALSVPVRLGGFVETLSLAGWVRTALMPLFFLVLGMQIKFEALRGELSNPRRLALPAAAALGGLVAPIGLYLALNHGSGAPTDAWPAAGATDIAFALAVLGLAGPRLGLSLRVLLMSVAMADDLAAVVLGAIFGLHRIDGPMLAGAAAVLAALSLLARWRAAPFLFYAAGFLLVWGFVLKSGLDPSLAGLACAMTAPIGMRRTGHESALKYFMDSLHPYVAFAALPLFVFTAAGVSLRAIAPAELASAPFLGMVLALWLGKPLGVFGFAWLATVLRLARRPTGAAWIETLGAAALSGAGLTVSLFLLTPAAGAPGHGDAVLRLAAVAGAAAAAASGWAILAWAEGRRAQAEAASPEGRMLGARN